MTPSSMSDVKSSLTRVLNVGVKASDNDTPERMPVTLTQGVGETIPTLDSKWNCVNENGRLRVTDAGYAKMCLDYRNEMTVSLRYSNLELRMETFNNDMNFRQLAEAGFYKNGQGLACFCCPFEPRIECLLTDPVEPMRVHTRWSPQCPFVRRRENEDVLRAVKQEVLTMEQRHDMTGIHPWRRTTFDINDVIEIMESGYEPSRIMEATKQFFLRTGEFPNVENLRREMND
ncbi:uncharacterized protein LOC110446779 isoform X2 [Mizuhopecten yessoensis]|uniref:Uncharacterized protein n=1 Tax=Mizuhopecten yessoensis TaxID=6573 RepID=A0A210QWN9_MIZYE|nr:uncharacterized protein LOC110446779 isoform X2 [Mizuhopecten yessoensis]OWF53170.1 hypothetical protein KP79_PYT06987 [Mizuhopecten yessoensis]